MRILYLILLLSLCSCAVTRSAFTDHSKKIEASKAAQYMKQGGVIVVLRCNQPKRELLRKLLRSPDLEAKEKNKLRQKLRREKLEQDSINLDIIQTFHKNYLVGKVYFINDSLYGAYFRDSLKENAFLNPFGKIDPDISGPEQNHLVMLSDKNYNYEILGPKHEYLKDPFPFKYKPSAGDYFKAIFFVPIALFSSRPSGKKLVSFIDMLNRTLK